MLSPQPWFLLVLWRMLLAVVIAGELLPGHSTPMELLSETHLSDTAMHFAAYAVLAFIPTIGLPVSTVLVCLLSTEFAGIALEFLQALIPGRSSDPYDALVNTYGLLFGAAFAVVIRWKFSDKLAATFR